MGVSRIEHDNIRNVCKLTPGDYPDYLFILDIRKKES